MSEQNAHNSSPTNYMPQLDTLRIFAVIMVTFEHWLYFGHWFRVLPFGEMGVTLFFVLSGFLITQILLKSREFSGSSDKNLFHSLKQFYVRRTLRIFPVYYITIFILFVINFVNIREKILWYLFYAYNIYFYKTHDGGGSTGHLWTLCVEEQFYLLWPFLILFIPKKYLFKSILIIILTGPVFRFISTAFVDQSAVGVNYTNKLPFACMDSLGLGALLAFIRYYTNTVYKISKFWLKMFYLLNAVSLIVIIFFYNFIINLSGSNYNALLIKQFLLIFNISVLSFCIISGASIGYKGFLKIIFENKYLMYLGKISYGLYLFHNFIPDIYNYLHLPVIQSFYLKYAVYWIMLILIASASWFIIEKPVNNLKKYFAYY